MEVGILLYINRKNDGFLTKKGEQKMKKIVAILLSVILLFALTGCGKKCYEQTKDILHLGIFIVKIVFGKSNYGVALIALFFISLLEKYYILKEEQFITDGIQTIRLFHKRDIQKDVFF